MVECASSKENSLETACHGRYNQVINIDKEKFSLIWPTGNGISRNLNFFGDSNRSINDLSIDNLTKAFSYNRVFRLDDAYLLSVLTDDNEVIRYRLDIIDDLLNEPQLVQCFEDILPMIDELSNLKPSFNNMATPLQQTVWRIGELDLYIECIKKCKSVFDSIITRLKSEGLKKFSSYMDLFTSEESFNSIANELPNLRRGLKSLASITIGVNLDPNLRPYEATILSINDEPFKGRSLVGKLFGKVVEGSEHNTGISSLLKIENLNKQLFDAPVYDAFQITLFDQINKIIGHIAKPIASTLHKYTSINSDFLVSLKQDIIFLLGTVKFFNKLKAANLPICKPNICMKDERIFKVKNIYNVNLAFNMINKFGEKDLSNDIVTNNVEFGEEGRIFILTGPNSGGKTTYVQSVGITQFLFQLGLFVPGSEASISAVDSIFTHFPIEEKPDSNLGRLGEESKRLNDIFMAATKYSLVLLNESLSSTSFDEGLYISKEVLAGLKIMEVRAIFVTHFHSLAKNLDEFNKSIPGDSKAVSMLSGVSKLNDDENSEDAIKRTYKIEPSPPQGLSYAKDIAARYGLDFKIIIDRLKSRGIINNEFDADVYEQRINSEI